MDYLYDGTYFGLMSALSDIFVRHTPHEIRSDGICLHESADYQGSFFTTPLSLTTDSNRAQSFAARTANELGPEYFERIMRVFLSDRPGRGDIILKFLAYAFAHGSQVMEHFQHPDVHPFRDLDRAVSREIHRMLGLIRFQRLEGEVFYAPYSPTYNITILLANHFANRMSDQFWVIHDVSRSLGLFYNKDTWHTAPLEHAPLGGLASEEVLFQEAWKTYFKRIAIKERYNPALQMGHMPKKYWKYLTEIE